jgi:ABC-type Fe3+/spermidine/putrescine transport system ATPase subunit
MVRLDLTKLERIFPDGSRIGPINLSVRDGELLTLLGPSGSGKTTTLRMIAGFLRPGSGSIEFDGVDITNIPPRDRNIGMVFQSIALFPNMNVYQNIAFGPEMAGWDHERVVKRVEELADLLDIKGLLLRKISEISGGEGQRVAIARALAKSPNLLLLDEPLSALDPHLRTRLQREIRRIQKQLSLTTVYVTHNQDEAFSISDRIAIIDDGIIKQVGTPGEIYSQPVDEFVASFIGDGNVINCYEINEPIEEFTIILDDMYYHVGTHSSEPNVKITVKPEDVMIHPKSSSLLSGVIMSINRLVRSWEFSIEINGQRIIALLEEFPEIGSQNASIGHEISITFDSGSLRKLE